MDYKKMKPIGLVRLMLTDGVITREQAAKYFPELADSEDEKTRKWIYRIIEYLGLPADEDAEKELVKMQPLALAWLEKQGEQKPTEWSEEDEEMLNLIIARLHSHPNVELEEYVKLYDWLNFHCSQKQWKPTLQQINALSIFVKHGQTDDPDALKKLLEQLKKLREE